MSRLSLGIPRPSRPRPRWGLQAKLIVSMLFVGAVPLVVGLGMAFWQGSKEIRDVNGESFKALATEAARKLDLLVADEVARTSRIAGDPSFVKALEHRRDQQASGTSPQGVTNPDEHDALWAAHDPDLVARITGSPLALLLTDYYTGTRGDPDQLLPQVVRSATKRLFVTDQRGTLMASMTATPAYQHAQTAWWQGAFNKGAGKLYIEDVHFDEQADTYVFSISVPVMDSLRYEVVGVVHRVIDAKEFFAPSTHAIRFGTTGHVMLIDSRGIVISCPILPTGLALSDPALTPLITPLQPGWVEGPSDGHGSRTASIIGFAPLPETSRATNGAITHGSWHTFVWQSSAELFAPIRHLFLWMTVFGGVAVGLLAVLGYVAASRIVNPVRTLQQAATAIGRGELHRPIEIQTGDELQDLAEEFNRMNAQLEAAFEGLSDQVTLKTQEVQSLRESTDHILEAVPTPIFLIDAQEQVSYVNHAAREAFHLTSDATGTVPFFHLLPFDPASLTALREEWLGHQPSTTRPTSTFATEPRDPLTPLSTSASPLRRAEVRIGPRLYHYQWFHLPGRPGDPPGTGLILRDTTEDRHLQDRLIQAEKSDSLGVLTAGIGHELNNPLFSILGLGEAIQDEPDLYHIRSYARDIVAHGRRMAAIIRDFTGQVARETSAQRLPVGLETTLDQAVEAVSHTLDMAGITVQKSYAGTTMVLALPEQLRQAFTNVVMNAVQAMQGTGTLTICTTCEDAVATVRIADTGPGIPGQHLARVFDPFFTTKGQGGGSGLGLTVAQRILRACGGDIRIDSREGAGTTCIITLPAMLSSPTTPEAPWTAPPSHSEPQPSPS